MHIYWKPSHEHYAVWNVPFNVTCISRKYFQMAAAATLLACHFVYKDWIFFPDLKNIFIFFSQSSLWFLKTIKPDHRFMVHIFSTFISDNGQKQLDIKLSKVINELHCHFSNPNIIFEAKKCNYLNAKTFHSIPC